MILIEGVSKSFKRVQALKDVSLTIEKGVFGLLGPNGAGKTTLMRILATVLPPSSGEASVFGYDVQRHKREIRQILGYLPQEFSSYPGLNGREYLEYVAWLKELPPPKIQSKVTELLEFVRLGGAAKRQTRAYSGGMLRRLGIAQALLNDPKVLLVDEPTGGLDPEERLRFRNFLVELSADRIVLLSTHLVEDIVASCEKLAVLNQGRLIYHGTVRELIQGVQGRVYEIELLEDQLPSWQNDSRWKVVTARRQGEKAFRVRFVILDEGQVPVQAEPATPSLEDAYLALIACDRQAAMA